MGMKVMASYPHGRIRNLFRRYRPFVITIAIIKLLALVVFTGFGILGRFPSLGAQGADSLRKLFGDRAVAIL
jgi:hypothetical protein